MLLNWYCCSSSIPPSPLPLALLISLLFAILCRSGCRILHDLCYRFPTTCRHRHTHTHAKQQHTRPRKQQILTEGENERANTSSKIEIARESSNPIKSKFMLFWWVFGLKIWNSEISFKRRLKHMTDFRIQCAVLCFAFFRIFISRSFQKQQQNNKNKRAPHTLVCSPIEWPLCMCDVLCSAQAHYYAGFAYVRIPFDSIELIYVMRAFNTSTFSIYARRRRRKKPN